MVSRLANGSDVMQRSPHVPQQPRSRRRWAVVAGIAVVWVILSYGAGSVVAGTILLMLLAVAVVIIMVAMRSLGIDRDHPWMQWLAARPGRDVSEPSPQIPWRDVSEPVGWRDDLSPAGPIPWRDVSDPAGPAAWRDVREPASPAARRDVRDGGAYVNSAAARTVVSEFVTVAAKAPVPLLRLLTNGQLSETRTPGARAGRGREAELSLPDEPTVSRVHAEFTFTDGQWHVTNLGLNGVTLNGAPLTGTHAIRDGDSIGWGTQPGALASRVEIGRDRARQPNGSR
jgi:FHA domain